MLICEKVVYFFAAEYVPNPAGEKSRIRGRSMGTCSQFGLPLIRLDRIYAEFGLHRPMYPEMRGKKSSSDMRSGRRQNQAGREEAGGAYELV